jgi:hypothetical protein
MLGRVLTLIIVFIAVMAVYGYLTPILKTFINNCVSIEDQMMMQQDGKSCEE